ncbi:hypothetical protein SmJEL517_g06298 [Synchytrium microbalum]|uniref:Nephrocystin 3-like N-terminal domain-containing protein n=1 Tax=Synchytrium microbalum TaxID=1806994 RepID=A0A507BXI7_9FUNG|nr:uncharacterized protein SmJEL517_g06298 [Synchytrium microbalum]TPX30003.1 hypothetical protein SmJEL517_g06298 [Synchytrium microbalum]
MRQELKDLYRAEPNFLINMPSIGLQLEQLIVRPLCKYRGDKAVILLDALDECAVEDIKLRSEFLETLGRTFARLPTNISIFVTSRPLQHLRKQLSNYTPRMMTLEATENLNDIKLYARYRVNRLRPFLGSDPSIDTLADKLSTMAHGLFVWLYLACDTIDKSDDPVETVAELEERTLGNDEDRMDAIYTRALVSSYKGAPESSIPSYTKQVGALVALRTAMSVEGLSALLGLSSTSVKVNLSRLESLLVMSKSSVQLMHKSVADFITSKDRCARDASPFYIDKQKAESYLSRMCLLALPSSLSHDSVQKQIERLRGIAPLGSPTHITYACSHWADHLDSVEELDEELNQTLLQALQIYGRGMLIVTVLKNRPCALTHILKVGGGSTLLKAAEDVKFFQSHILEEAVTSNHADICEALLKYGGADVDCPIYGGTMTSEDSKGFTPLRICILSTLIESLKVILRHGADMDNEPYLELFSTGAVVNEMMIERLRRRVELEESNMDDMMNAARLGDVGRLKQLLEINPLMDINRQYKDCGNKTLLVVASHPLHHACSFGSLDIVKALMTAGSLLDGEGLDNRDSILNNKFYRPIDVACEQAHIDIVSWLLDNGVSPSALADGKVHPLFYAAVGGSVEIIQLLLSKGVDVNYQSKYLGTAIYGAALTGAENSAAYLLSVGADSELGLDAEHVEMENIRMTKFSPLNIAMSRSYSDIVAMLLPRSRAIDKSVELKLNYMGIWISVFTTPLVLGAINDNPKLVQIMLDYGEDLERQMPVAVIEQMSGSTALLYAAAYGRINIARMLLDAGADIKAVSAIRRTCLHIVASKPLGDRNKSDMVRLLRFYQAGLDDVDLDGCTALYLAVTAKGIQTVETLLELGANVNIADNLGNTPLHEAVKRNAGNMVTVLVNGGADKTKENLEGMTPLKFAQKQGYNNLVQLLK